MSAPDDYSGEGAGEPGTNYLASPTATSTGPAAGTDLSPTKPQSANGHDAYDDGSARERDRDYRGDEQSGADVASSPAARDRPPASASQSSASSYGGGRGGGYRQSARKVYVGNLPPGATQQDVMDLFARSPVPCALPSQVDMKLGYAFVVSTNCKRSGTMHRLRRRAVVTRNRTSQNEARFEHSTHEHTTDSTHRTRHSPGAVLLSICLCVGQHFDEVTGVDDAVSRLNGSDLNGSKVRVELSKPQSSSRCYTCGLEGHMSSQCSHASSRGGGRQPYAPSSSASSRYGAPPPSRYPPSGGSSYYPRSRSPDRFDPRYDLYARPRSPPRYYDRGAPPPPPARGYEPRRDDRGRSPGRDRERDRGYDRAGYDAYYPPPEPRGAYGGGYDRAPPPGPPPPSAYPPPPPAAHGYAAAGYPPPPPSGSVRPYY